MRDSDRRLRTGIVGLGTMGGIHADRIAATDHELVAGADVAAAARERFSEEYDVAVYEDHDALLTESLDVVFVTTPNRFHEAAAVAALREGVDVLVEKPLAHNLESAERMVNAAGDTDATLSVGFTMRCWPTTTRLRRLIDDERLGKVTHVETSYVRRQGVPGDGRGWFTDSSLAGGGALMDIGVHSLDLALTVLGHPEPRSVAGAVRTEFGEYDVDDSATAFVRCANGATVTLETAWRANCDPEQCLVVRGTEAGAHLDLLDGTLRIVDGDGPIDDLRYESDDDVDVYGREDAGFLNALVAGDPTPVGTATEGLRVQRVLDGIYRADAREEQVSLR